MPKLIATPKWITESYRPDLQRPHYAVKEVTSEGFILSEINLYSVNPFTVGLHDLAHFAQLKGDSFLIEGTLEDLYKWSRTNSVEIVDTPNTDFSEVLKADPNYIVPMSFGSPSIEIQSACLVAHDYEDFLKVAEDYEKDPANPVVAFKFIDSHPMYWHFEKIRQRAPRRRSGKPEDTSEAPAQPIDRIEIMTGHGWSRVQVEIIRGQFSFETSGTPYHTQTNYHDYGLDVYSKSMDDGICELAAKIHSSYDLEGNLRNGDDEPNGSH